tara:strand:+ start:1336 stop:1794 length:459 start_codon:yes stop_codon:yes gene_type:complete
MKWNEAQRLMTTARDKTKGKPIGNNTRLYFESAWGEKHYTIRLHGNVIMKIYRDRIVPLDGGWRTVTTKARLNEHLPQGFYVFQKDWEWFLQDMYATNPDDPDKALVYPFGDVYYISTKDFASFVHGELSSKVMLYSTHPKYPEVYEKEMIQ